MYRRSAVLRSFLALLAAVGWLSSVVTIHLHEPWIGLGVVPFSFVPAVLLAWRLTQRLDATQREAYWIGVPTIVTLGLAVGFSVASFSKSNPRIPSDALALLGFVGVIACFSALLYLGALRLAFRKTEP